jgi:hypothetical protein
MPKIYFLSIAKLALGDAGQDRHVLCDYIFYEGGVFGVVCVW